MELAYNPKVNAVARKKKKEFLWNPDFDPEQSKDQIIKTLETFWIPLLEEALYQAKRAGRDRILEWCFKPPPININRIPHLRVA